MAEVDQPVPFVTAPDTWTAEQAGEFRKAWDEAAADGSLHRRARWLIPRRDAQMVALDIRWDEDGQERQELFGPWTSLADGDLSHMEAAHGFLGDWCRLSGREPSEVVAKLLADPDEWIAVRS